MKKKRPGYYYRFKKNFKTRIHEGDTIVLENYPTRARVYIIQMLWELPTVKIKIKN